MAIDSEGLAQTAAIIALTTVVDQFGQAWSDDPSPPSTDPDEIARIRRAIILPVCNGALMGICEALWLTAPPGTEAAATRAHLELLIPAVIEYIEAAGRPAGDFWTREVAAAERAARGRAH